MVLNILFVNACVRGEESNTLKLCKVALEEWKQRYPEAQFSEVNLEQIRPQALYPEDIKRRDDFRHAGTLSDPMFDFAHQFAKADKILIGAPYWDLSFPAVLKIYLEHISVVDITFRYTEHGPVGCCQADELLYITTSGGPVGPADNMGFDYIKGLCTAFYGISKLHCFAVNGLEMGGDIDAMICEGERKLRLQMETDTL